MDARTRRGLLCCCLLVLGALAAVTATAAPPPAPFCGACGDAFEESVAGDRPGVAVEESTATIAVHENGSATWTVRNRLDDADDAAALADDPDLAEVVRYGPLGDARFLGASVAEERTLLVRYRDPSFAEPAGGGTLRSGAFTYEYGYRNLHGLGADRLAVVAPPDTQVDWTVPGATVSADGERTTLTSLERRGFVTFVPRDRTAAGASLASLAAVGRLVLPSLLANAFWLALVPAVVVGSLAAGAASALVRPSTELARVRRHTVAGIAGLGALSVALGVAIAGGVGSGAAGAGPAAIGVGLGLLAVAGVLRRRLGRGPASARTLATTVGGGVCVAVAGALAVALAFEEPGSIRAYPWRVLVVAPLLGFVLVGFAVARGQRGVAAATAALGLAVALLSAVPVGDVFLGRYSLAIDGAGLAVQLVALGAPFALVGVSLARSEGASEHGANQGASADGASRQ